MNRYLIIATDERSYLDLINVVLELKKRNLPYFFLYNNSPTKLYPNVHLEHFSYDTNIKSNSSYLSKTLGFNLPFKPTVLLITNENWEPEKSILLEFKQWGCYIGCIENSSWTYNNIKTKLEIASRKSFPSNCIDVFFDHSSWGAQTKKEAGWWGQKSVIVGNPKFDKLKFETTEENVIIVYGSLEKEHHDKIINVYHSIKSSFPTWEVYYKPHPTEIKDYSDWENCDLILTQKEFFNILQKSSYNIGIFSSIMYYPLKLNKNIVAFNLEDIGVDEELNIDNFKGEEFNFWKNILNFNNFEDFKNFISTEYIINTKKRNKDFQNHFKKNLISYNKDNTFITNKSNNKDLLKYFDDFNDGKASQRIINYIENEQKIF